MIKISHIDFALRQLAEIRGWRVFREDGLALLHSDRDAMYARVQLPDDNHDSWRCFRRFEVSAELLMKWNPRDAVDRLIEAMDAFERDAAEHDLRERQCWSPYP